MDSNEFNVFSQLKYCNYIIEFKFYSLPICWTELILVTVGGTATTH